MFLGLKSSFKLSYNNDQSLYVEILAFSTTTTTTENFLTTVSKTIILIRGAIARLFPNVAKMTSQKVVTFGQNVPKCYHFW